MHLTTPAPAGRPRALARRALAAALLALLIAGGVPGTARAQEDAEQDAEEPAQGTLAAHGYGDTSLRGTYGSADVFVPLPAGTLATGATVVLDLLVSPLLIGRSTFTLQAGGVDVASIRLDGGQPEQELEVDVPADRIGDTGLALGFRGYLRLTDDDCEEADNPGQWVTVADTSTVELDLVRRAVDLADVPRLFAGPPDRALVGIDLPGGAADDAVLQVGATAAWQLGRWRAARSTPALVTTRVSDLPRAAPRIVVATGAEVSDDVLGDADGGVLAVSNDPGPRLDVGGRDGAALAAAAATLTAPATLATLTAPAAAVAGLAAVPAPTRSAPWTGERTTFAQLGLDRQTVVGTGTREVALRIDRPAGWTITEDVLLTLDVDASAALRRPTSTVQLLVNGIDVGTRPLAGGQGPTRHRFTLPAGLADRTLAGRPVRTLDLLVRMVLDLPEAGCSAPEVAAATASLLPTSTLQVVHAEAEGLDLARFPAPLAGADGGDAATIVVPDGDLDEATLDAVLQVAAALGRWAGADAAPPRLVRAAGAAPTEGSEDGGTGGRIVVGAAAVDEVAGDLLADLLADLRAGGQLPAPGDGVVLALTDGLGDGPALLLRGEGEDLVAAARLLADREHVQQLAGDVVVVRGDAAVVTSDGLLRQPPPELAPPDRPWFQRDRDRVVPAVVIGLALLGMLLLVVGLRWWPMARVPRPDGADGPDGS
jgi:hypothetical protein